MTYDLNGNIKTLKRKQREYGWGTTEPAYTSHTIDSLTYSYASADKNKLAKVDDPSADNTGFKNGSSATTEYRYDINGNLTSDKNKGIDSVYYNFMGKPVRIDFSDHKSLRYTYDAAGIKLTQKLYNYDTLKTTTQYANGFVYEAIADGSPVLSFFGSPEGRVVNNSGTLQYEYSIADHQGNTRVVFSSQASIQTLTATFEASTNPNFTNYPTGGGRNNTPLYNNTPSGTYSQYLNGGYNGQIGVAKSFKVYPGDKVKIEAYGKYRTQSGGTNITGVAAALTGVFGVSSSSTGEALKAFNALDDYGAFIAAGGEGQDLDEGFPKLFVTILLFDKDHNFVKAAWEQIDGGQQVGVSPDVDHDYMGKEVSVEEAGYAYLYVSNENATQVDFYVDDVVMTYTPTNVIQYNEYYPFGLQTSASWTRDQTKDNNYLYNAANELNKTSGWYEMYYRGYDPAIGRMLQVDPFAPLYASTTTYNYALNNPVMMNDPSGGQTSVVGYTDSQLHTMFRQSRFSGGTADFGDWAFDNLDGRDAGDRKINGGDGNTYQFDESGQIGRYGWVEYTGMRDGDVMWVVTRWEKLRDQGDPKTPKDNYGCPPGVDCIGKAVNKLPEGELLSEEWNHETGWITRKIKVKTGEIITFKELSPGENFKNIPLRPFLIFGPFKLSMIDLNQVGQSTLNTLGKASQALGYAASGFRAAPGETWNQDTYRGLIWELKYKDVYFPTAVEKPIKLNNGM